MRSKFLTVGNTKKMHLVSVPVLYGMLFCRQFALGAQCVFGNPKVGSPAVEVVVEW